MGTIYPGYAMGGDSFFVMLGCYSKCIQATTTHWCKILELSQEEVN